MLNIFLACAISATVGAMLLALFVMKDEPTPSTHHIFIPNEEFVDEWRSLEERTGVTLSGNIAHQLCVIEKASARLFFTIPLDTVNHQEEQNRFGFAKWLVANGKFTDFPADELA